MLELPESRLQVHCLLLLLFCLETLLRRLVPVGEGFSVHDKHVVNTVCPYIPEVADQQVSLMLKFLQSHRLIVVK